MSNPLDPTNQTKRSNESNKPVRFDRFVLACQCGLILYACCAGYGAYMVWHSNPSSKASYGIVLGFPAIATLVFLAVSMIVPGLYAPRRMKFPLNFTLPLVYTSLLILTVILCTSTGNSLILPFEQLKIAKFWLSPAVLALLVFSQVVCLSAMVILKSESVD